MMARRATTGMLVGILVMGAAGSSAAQAPPTLPLTTPARPRFPDGTERAMIACGRLVARLPMLEDPVWCGDAESRPSMLVGSQYARTSFGPDYVDFDITVEERGLDAVARAESVAAFASWPSHFMTASPRLKVQRGVGVLEVRIDDGSVFEIRISWADESSFVDGDHPSAALLTRVGRSRERLDAQLLLTLEPGPVAPVTAGTVRLRDLDAEIRLADGLGIRVPRAGRPLPEPGCETRYEIFDLHSPIHAARIDVCPDGRVVQRTTGVSATVFAAMATFHVGSVPAPAPSSSSPCPWEVNDPAPPLRARASFSSHAAIVGTLENGARVTLVERHGRWARITAPVAGWIWTENLEERCP